MPQDDNWLERELQRQKRERETNTAQKKSALTVSTHDALLRQRSAIQFPQQKASATGQKNWIENLIDSVNKRYVKPKLDSAKASTTAKGESVLGNLRPMIFFAGINLVVIYAVVIFLGVGQLLVAGFAAGLVSYFVAKMFLFKNKVQVVEQQRDCKTCFARMREFLSTPQQTVTLHARAQPIQKQVEVVRKETFIESG